MTEPDYTAIAYETRDRKAYITLNRPERLNAINDQLPFEIASAVARANDDDDVRVIVIQGAGDSFCAGYDLKQYAEQDAEHGRWQQTDPWDPVRDYRQMRKNTDAFFTLWRSLKPTIAKVRGYAIAGGSDIALCADILVMAEDARIGYPPARVWGCPTTAMWVYRLGAQRAKRMLLTGDTITGVEAEEWGLALEAVPEPELDSAVEALADRMSGMPTNQLVMQKMMINQAYDNMGLSSTQTLATFFDGITRHSAEGDWFKRFAERDGFHAAVAWRDSGALIPDGGGDLPTEDESGEVAATRGWTAQK
ncbi:crotonase/enoyl-CoA hydratase family protein [Epidermidibacterium keratini]|uniref:Crotonase/enoyl-CoA hydratase family protein n=1 Tax=Epidermidibacterium keratini TaxID=1891644 RepID=A0A7M3T533_9ACTN|nr:crotonase/enoyl-CoA hydratase family protein [Epidermidibacterium keratini]QHB98894.1 crotonase/enoyl-CoA hydratase family protein [Epidermidibacterium keratini]